MERLISNTVTGSEVLRKGNMMEEIAESVITSVLCKFKEPVTGFCSEVKTYILNELAPS